MVIITLIIPILRGTKSSSKWTLFVALFVVDLATISLPDLSAEKITKSKYDFDLKINLKI